MSTTEPDRTSSQDQDEMPPGDVTQDSSEPLPGVITDGGRAAGKAARKTLPRSSLGLFEPASDRPDPVEVLVEQGRSRVPELLPLRYARMLVSPFTFYRGAAAVMAADLGGQPNSGLQVQLCGDAHLANFGGFAAPDRTVVFDVNDFDETIPGPFEWDLKRLVASFVIAARERGFPEKDRRALAATVVREYRDAMASFADMQRLDVWYKRLDSNDIRQNLGSQVGAKEVASFDALVTKAKGKTSAKAFSRYATRDKQGNLRLLSQPPLLVPMDELLDPSQIDEANARIQHILDAYSGKLLADRRWLLAGYEVVGVARKVVGVGSVGTRCWVVLMVAKDDDQDELVLQVKEAQRSVLDQYLGTNEYPAQGERVVAGQRIMQATGDLLLGWDHVVGLDGTERDFYIRQMWDWKVAGDLTTMTPTAFAQYAHMCGWTLARAHARSGDRKAVAGYLGGGDTITAGLADYAEAYADQNERDYARLKQAATDGRIEVAASPDN